MNAFANKTAGRYNLSKLIQLYTVIKLASIVDPLDSSPAANSLPIVINSVDPCFCETGLSREVSGFTYVVVKAFAAFAARPADDGARQVVQAAACGRETHGLYLRAGNVQAYKPIACDNTKTEYLWQVLCKRLKKLVSPHSYSPHIPWVHLNRASAHGKQCWCTDESISTYEPMLGRLSANPSLSQDPTILESLH